ncbi:hypothetical protein YSA_00398 [Pseudomonas putida ND6]|uniref:Uncharacterized protein n=1 Tax=Pseudomonas putida ND6 TaxID=231023 RepID=I3UNB7_PSEPU|nr:hypothetical protein YSA_00398 [Pseudomonas putida ND6]
MALEARHQFGIAGLNEGHAQPFGLRCHIENKGSKPPTSIKALPVFP